MVDHQASSTTKATAKGSKGTTSHRRRTAASRPPAPSATIPMASAARRPSSAENANQSVSAPQAAAPMASRPISPPPSRRGKVFNGSRNRPAAGLGRSARPNVVSSSWRSFLPRLHDHKEIILSAAQVGVSGPGVGSQFTYSRNRRRSRGSARPVNPRWSPTRYSVLSRYPLRSPGRSRVRSAR